MSPSRYTDYHMHSTFSLDGHYSPAEMCEAALARGVEEIAITDHVEWEPSGRHTRPDFAHYFASLDDCRSLYGPRGLTIYSGLELGNPHQHRAEVDDLLAAYAFDVVIASLHWLDGQNIHATHCFEDRDPYVVYAAYFADLGRMASVECDLIAHFDRIFWPGTQLYGPPLAPRLENAVRPALAQIASHGRVLELNTRFLTYEPSWNDVLVTVLTWFRAEGGTHVAVNSDAHRVAEIGRHWELGQSIVQAAGFPGPAPLSIWHKVTQPAA